MKRGTVSIEVLLFLAGTVVILAVLIIPWAHGQWVRWINGKCWYDTYTNLKGMKAELGKMRPGETKEMLLHFGDCTGGIIVANRSDVPDLYKEVFDDRCNDYKSYKSYILAYPWKGLEAELRRDSSWWEKVKDFFSDVKSGFVNVYKVIKGDRRFKELFSKPLCESLEIEFQSSRGKNVMYMPNQPDEEGYVEANGKPFSVCLKLKKHQSDEGTLYFTMTESKGCGSGEKE